MYKLINFRTIPRWRKMGPASVWTYTPGLPRKTSLAWGAIRPVLEFTRL